MNETVKLEEGEVLCDKCNGHQDNWYACKKCHGTGKLDWVENARGGKQSRGDLFTIDASSFNTYASSLSVISESVKVDGIPLNEYMANKIAEEVDKQILAMLQNPSSVLRTQMKKENT